MIIFAKSEKDLERLERIAKSRSQKGAVVDPIHYSGPSGNYVMVYDGTKYVPEFKVKDYSLLMGFDANALSKIVIKE